MYVEVTMRVSLRWIRIFSVSLLVIAIPLAWASPAYAAEANCTSTGGTWSGIDADNGTCTYPTGSSMAVASCGSSKVPYEVTYASNVETDANCLRTRTATRISSDGGSPTNFVLHIKGSVKGTVEFFGGTCQQNCTIDTVLPDNAKESLDDVPLATVYVRIDGGAGTGSYHVCFSNPLGEGLNLFQFVGGNWILASHSHGNPICTVASGDSAFYLH